MQSYEEAFEKIKQATGISDPDEFVTQFIKVEDQNFSLFNYVNELNTEIEKLEEQARVVIITIIVSLFCRIFLVQLDANPGFYCYFNV